MNLHIIQPPIPNSMSRTVLKNAIFAQFQGSIILKVYKISQRNLSYGETKLYIYKIKKIHHRQMNTLHGVGLKKMTRMPKK